MTFEHTARSTGEGANHTLHLRPKQRPASPPAADPLSRFDSEGGAMQPVSPRSPDPLSGDESPGADDDPRQAPEAERHERGALRQLRRRKSSTQRSRR